MIQYKATHLILSLAIVLFVALFFAKITSADSITLFQNQTYSNVTVNIFDYDGNSLYEGSTYPKLEVYNSTGSLLKSLTCTAASCRIINITPGTYSFKVYWHQVEVAHINDTLKEGENTIEIRCNVKKARIRVVDDADRALKNVDVSLIGPLPGYDMSFSFNTGGSGEIKKFLPFGTYKLSSATWQWGIDDKTMSISAVVEENAEYSINAQNDFIKIPMKVSHSLTFAFYTIDDQELVGSDAKVEVRFKYRGDWQKILEKKLEHNNKVTLGPLPYGEYQITVYWSDESILTEKIALDSEIYDELVEGVLKIKVHMYKNLLVRFVDAEGEPLRDTYIVLVFPSGGNASYVTDDVGGVRLCNITAGNYVVKVRWLAGYAETELDLTPGQVSENVIKVVLDFYKVNLVLKSRGSATLPIGLKITFRCNTYILLNESLESEVKNYEKTFEKLYSKSPYYYYLDISYMGYSLFSDRVNIAAKNIVIDLDLYDLTVTVLSMHNYTLPGAKLCLEYPKGGNVVAAETDNYGKYLFKHLIVGYGPYKLSVYWKDYLVGSFTLKEKDIVEGDVELRVNVYDIYVKVYNVLHSGLKDATVAVYLKNTTAFIPLGNASTDPTGLAKISGIPVPPGYDITINVNYKNRFKLENIIIEHPERSKEIVMNVLFEVFGVPLSPIEIGTIALVSVVGTLGAYFFLRWYRFKETLTSMFSETEVQPEAFEYEIEEEEEKKKNVLSKLAKKIKDRIEELFGGGEESEEEYDIFG